MLCNARVDRVVRMYAVRVVRVHVVSVVRMHVYVCLYNCVHVSAVRFMVRVHVCDCQLGYLWNVMYLVRTCIGSCPLHGACV